MTERVWRTTGRWSRFVAACFVVVCLTAGCRKSEEPTTRTEAVTLFGKTATVTLPQPRSHLLGFAAQMYRTHATRHHDLLDVLNPDSEISELNRIGPNRGFPVSDDTYRILYVASELCERTRGTYDFTVAPLAYLWGFEGGIAPSEPVPDSIVSAAMRGVGYKNVDVREQLVRYETPHTRVSLGDLETSYSVDLTIIKLREKGVRNILIDAGSIARSQGVIGQDEPWTRDLAHPFHLGEQVGVYRLNDGMGAATVTKNDAYVVIGEDRYNHIIDPRNGRPAAGTAAVCVLAPSATDACALAQALFVVGVEDARGLLAEFVRCHVLIIPDREPMELWMTEGFQERIDLEPSMYNRVFLF